MPKRTDIKTILILGAGPIVIGQACEFDYSGTQACIALREEGYKIVLVNSNPATIMTDPETADSTYIEPIEWQTVAKIIERERPCALLPTMGGQTALNCALDLAREGILEKYNVAMIGATRDAIDKAEDRERFRQAMEKIGLAMPNSGLAHNMEEALKLQESIGFPTIIRPCFTLGGRGGGIAYNRYYFIAICKQGLDASPTHELLIDESVIGWKEYEMEVVRDSKDNCIIICSIENIDPMGIHTGDSITVAPALTLTDKEYQTMRDASIAVLREIGVDTGGANVQFAINPQNGDMIVVEMNPRVSRSSALASKATGFPIARIAAKLAVGYTLDELENEITGGKTPASFEPSIDYIVTKIPRFNFDKFPKADDRLTTQMRSVGEVMAIGRTFQESLQKAIRGLEVGKYGFESILEGDDSEQALYELRRELRSAGDKRLWYIGDSFRLGFSVEKVAQYTNIDPWFLAQIEDIIKWEQKLAVTSLRDISEDSMRLLKRKGFSDVRIAQLLHCTEEEVRVYRHELKIRPIYKRIDTCAAEFATETAYMYSTYGDVCEAKPTQQKKYMILGGGPNRIGQGIEFDYCCVHAAMALREDGYEVIMVNCNPETVSTDYHISDRLYFEPLTLEDILEIVDVEKPAGVIVQYGGQTPLKLALSLEQAGVPIIGTSPDAIDRAEDRGRFQTLISKLGLCQPRNAVAESIDEGLGKAKELGYPLVVRPSYVLGGQAMRVVYNDEELHEYLEHAVTVSHDSPVLLDQFLDNAIEVDIDAISDGQAVFIGGIMEHIEQAGVHSGDSSCSLPPFSLGEELQNRLRKQISQLALELGVVGLVNGQFAIQEDEIFILEVNPRAARTIPFVAKAIGLPLAKVAVRAMVGKMLKEQSLESTYTPDYFSVKRPVFPFNRFNADPILGPEMRSTGEAMGIGRSFGEANAKANLSTGEQIKPGGTVFISVRDSDKQAAIPVAKNLVKWGYQLVATHGTCKTLQNEGLDCRRINKVLEGQPHIVDLIKNNEIDYIVNTTEGKYDIADSYEIRRQAVQHNIRFSATIADASANILSWEHELPGEVNRLQDLIKG